MLNDYVKRSGRTAIYPGAHTGSEMALAYVTMGLAGEAGEVANKLKKVLRDGTTVDSIKQDMLGELGDVLWYWARLCDELGLNAEDIAMLNLAKLADRQQRGKLGGSGDNR